MSQGRVAACERIHTRRNVIITGGVREQRKWARFRLGPNDWISSFRKYR